MNLFKKHEFADLAEDELRVIANISGLKIKRIKDKSKRYMLGANIWAELENDITAEQFSHIRKYLSEMNFVQNKASDEGVVEGIFYIGDTMWTFSSGNDGDYIKRFIRMFNDDDRY